MRSRKQQKAATRESLLQAARAVLKRNGLANTSARMITEEAGVAAGTLFVHFPDLGALVEALLDEHLRATLDGALVEAERHVGLVPRLVHAAERLYAAYAQEPELAKAYLSGTLFPTAPGGPLTERLWQFQGWVFRQLEAAIAAGEVRHMERELAFNSYFALYFGFLVAGLSGWMSEEEQRSQLEAGLRRIFLLECA